MAQFHLSSSYAMLNSKWLSTTKIIFKDEIGELSDYAQWLKEYLPNLGKRKSYVSGKEVTLVRDYYPSRALFISADEIKDIEMKPLTINEIKDIDSIINAVSEKWMYAGNKILGNSNFVESSDLIIDSQYVIDSADISESTYVFGSSLIRKGSKYIFGSHFGGNGEFIVRTGAFFNVKRVFESFIITDSSDIYFSHLCEGCNELLFSFFQKNKSYCIGNLQLSKDKYFSLKNKIISEVAYELKKHKKFPSLFEIISNKKLQNICLAPKKEAAGDIKPIERAFSSTFNILFKKEASSLVVYEKWLSKHLSRIKDIKSAFGYPTYMLEGTEFPCLPKMPPHRLVSFYEGIELGNLSLEEKDITSLAHIIENLYQIAFFTVELRSGRASNIISSPLVYNSSDIYKVYDATFTLYAGVCSMALNSKYVFGCYRILESEFCIKCYNSLYLKRCFELDSSTKCSDSFFCHNCEGLLDCMFCFNIKAKRNTIGNLSLPSDKYKILKMNLIEQIGNELNKNGDLKWDIYNIGGL
ncbi:MAG: hypothetical protein QXF86_00785 [Candidatus Bilamarchaeaceae archaeon]